MAAKNGKNTIEILGIRDILQKKLFIPDYQRPYKWSAASVSELVSDIKEAAESAEKFKDYRYRIGTVILHRTKREGEECFGIIDGQQRLVSLMLIELALDGDYTCPLLEESFKGRVSKESIKRNYFAACDFICGDTDAEQKLKKALSSVIEAVVITVENESEAFQLFDSQNTRGRPLDPHDLLKAYHLREMSVTGVSEEDTKKAVNSWESVNASEIRDLFLYYLFPIRNWAGGKKSHRFGVRDIDAYKGVSQNSEYTYAQRAKNAMPIYQIGETFIAGESFFGMVEKYLEKKKAIKDFLESEKVPDQIKKWLSRRGLGAGFEHARALFYAAVLCYYDRFANFDLRAVKKMFLWAFMLRVDMEMLSFESVNRYAIGTAGSYTNAVNMFAKIREARSHNDIALLQIAVVRKNDQPANEKWRELYGELKILAGVGVGV